MTHFFIHNFSKVINHVMEKGNKQLARNLVEKAFENIKRSQIERYHLATTPEAKAKIELDPKKILHKAIANSKPLLQLQPIKRGGITYQVNWLLHTWKQHIQRVGNSVLYRRCTL